MGEPYYSDELVTMPQNEYDAWQREVLALCWDALVDFGGVA